MSRPNFLCLLMFWGHWNTVGGRAPQLRDTAGGRALRRFLQAEISKNQEIRRQQERSIKSQQLRIEQLEGRLDAIRWAHIGRAGFDDRAVIHVEGGGSPPAGGQYEIFSKPIIREKRTKFSSGASRPYLWARTTHTPPTKPVIKACGRGIGRIW